MRVDRLARVEDLHGRIDADAEAHDAERQGADPDDARQTVDAHCDPATKLCDEEGIDATSVGKTHSIVAPIAYGVGALATVAGLYLLLRKNDPKQAMLLPRIGTGGGGVSFQASF